jgi:hypothetical protein
LLSEIDTLQKDQLQSRFETTQIERYQVFLGIAILLLVISELIPDRSVENNSQSWINRFRRSSQVQRDSKSPSWN